MTQDETKEQELEKLFRKEYARLLRYARSVFRGGGGLGSYEKAEEAVQEVFTLAWAKQEAFFASPESVGWLYRAVNYTIWNILRAERKQTDLEFLMECSQEVVTEQQSDPRLSLGGMVPPEDLELLHSLYVEGYTFQEMADKRQVKKSALAMKVSRIKKTLRKELSKKD